MDNQPIQEFYAVTENSIHKVVATEPYRARVTRIADTDSGKRMDEPFGHEMHMIAIEEGRLMTLSPDGYGAKKPERNPGLHSTKYWGAITSPIVDLFFSVEKAFDFCFDKGEDIDAETEEVLAAIGPDHLSFWVTVTSLQSQGARIKSRCEQQRAEQIAYLRNCKESMRDCTDMDAFNHNFEEGRQEAAEGLREQGRGLEITGPLLHTPHGPPPD